MTSPSSASNASTHPLWRVAAVVLVLANLAYFAWSRGALAGLGLQPARFAQAEPHRLARQVRPALLQVSKEVPLPAPVTAPDRSER